VASDGGPLPAPRLDRELAGGTGPEASASLAARAMRLTSMRFRHDLAASVQWILVAAGQPPAVLPSPPVAGHPPTGVSFAAVVCHLA
jgi:hypothetical protein